MKKVQNEEKRGSKRQRKMRTVQHGKSATRKKCTLEIAKHETSATWKECNTKKVYIGNGKT